MVKISSPRAALQFVRKNKKEMFWLWIGYQAVKGTITLTFIWVPLFLLWKQRGGFEALLPEWGLFSFSMMMFIIAHTVLLQQGSKTFLTRLVGRTGGFLTQYVVSILTVSLALFAALQAPRDMVWSANMFVTVMSGLMVFLGTGLIAFGTHIANPFSVFRKQADFSPDRPGILAITRHPVLWGISTSALGLLFMNGQMSMIAFFGVLSLFVAMIAISLEKRRKALSDPDQWREASLNTSFVPNLLSVPKAFSTAALSVREVAVRIVIWFLLMAALILLHISVIEIVRGPVTGIG